MSIFFRTWCQKFVEDIFPQHVFLPKTKEEIAKAMGEYSILGLIGAICSMDVTHFRWDRCPYTQQNLYRGKEGYPTVAVEMACTHDRRIIHCMDGAYGSLNDKAIVRFDMLSELLQTKSAFPGVEFEVRTNSTGGREKLKGPYAIVDGGYHKWRHLMSASRLISDPDFVAWRQRLESVRKDIECAFGMLKGRFRCVKLPIRVQKKEQIDDIVKTCVGLHNMLLDWDDRGKWECGIEWGKGDGLFTDDGKHWGVPTVHGENVFAEADYSRFGRIMYNEGVIIMRQPRGLLPVSEVADLHCENSKEWAILQGKLVKSYKFQRAAGDTQWL